MNFVVKDLMISVLPLRGVDLGQVAGSCGACSADSSGPPCSGICPGTRNPITIWLDAVVSPAQPAALAALKQQLQEALAVVEAREKVVLDSLRPKSALEVQLLQGHLKGALEDLASGHGTKG